MTGRDERKLKSVPGAVIAAVLVALALHIGWQSAQPHRVAHAEELGLPPASHALRVASAGESIALAGLMTLYLQAFDNQPGVSIPFRNLDYRRVTQWLGAALDLDPAAQYPLLMAAQVYSLVPDPARQRIMFDFVYRRFLDDPDRRWRWLAHAAVIAKHKLEDSALALRWAEEIAHRAPAAPSWARQMRIFILEDLGEVESARILLGGLLASGEIKDDREIHFLTERLDSLQGVDKSAPASRK